MQGDKAACRVFCFSTHPMHAYSQRAWQPPAAGISDRMWMEGEPSWGMGWHRGRCSPVMLKPTRKVLSTLICTQQLAKCQRHQPALPPYVREGKEYVRGYLGIYHLPDAAALFIIAGKKFVRYHVLDVPTAL